MASPTEFTIYVVVHDDAVRDSICTLLQVVRFLVCPFASSNAFLRSHRPVAKSCLIVDDDMPDVSGFELLEQLRSEGTHIPAIVMTLSPSATLHAESERLDAILLEKPSAPDKLIGNLGKAIARMRGN
jgi:two-component system, LuxR family, response regulator FixJ